MASGLMRAFGGLVEGVGKGLEQQVQRDWEEERDQRLFELQSMRDSTLHEYGQEDIQVTGKVNEVLAQRDDERQVVLEDRRAAHSSAAAAQDREYEIADREDEQEHDLTLEEMRARRDAEQARLESALNRVETREAERYQEDLRTGRIRDQMVGEDGYWYVLRENGETERTPIRATERDRAASRGSRNEVEEFLSQEESNSNRSRRSGAPETNASASRGGPGIWTARALLNVPVSVENDQDFERLRDGQMYIGPDGVVRRK